MYPVHVSAHHDTPPNRWLWLVKWLLLLPHYAVLAILWAVMAVLTLLAYVAVLCTGRYPKACFDFSVGVLRWTWRVMYYGYVVLGTDRYPPFSLRPVLDYPAHLDVDAALNRRRTLPLVAWLVAIPHAVILAGLLDVRIVRLDVLGLATIPVPVGVTSLGITVAAIHLAITGRHPQGLYDMFTGIARWLLRTVAYVVLVTDVPPPLRLDQGGAEPAAQPPAAPAAEPAVVSAGVV